MRAPMHCLNFCRFANVAARYSGVAMETKQGNMTITINRRDTIASCIVIGLDFPQVR